jgi:hypothetical protein
MATPATPATPLNPSSGLAWFLVALFAGLFAEGHAAQPPAPAPAGTILLREQDFTRGTTRHLTLTPDGKTEAEFATPGGWPGTAVAPHDVLRSPDGTRAALTGTDTRPRTEDGTDPPQWPVFLCSFPGGKALTPLGGDLAPEIWPRGGGTLIARELPADPNGIGRFVAIDLATGGRAALPVPDAHWLRDRSPDGNHYLSTSDPDGKPAPRRLYLLDRRGRVVRPLTDDALRSVGPAVFEPGGRSVVLTAAPRAARPVRGLPAWKLYRTGVEAPRPVLLTDLPDTALVGGFALSPDGKQVAYARRPRVPVDLNPRKMLDPEAETDEVEYAVVVVGVDGTNARVIRSVKTRRPFAVQLDVIDWR